MANETRFLKEDYRWIRQMFVTDPDSFDDFLRAKRTATSNFYKYEDTTLGGHRTMNPPPQSNRYCDPKGERLFEGISRGMGDYYSEAIDDNLRTISFACGVPEYTGLLSFFSNFYSSDAAQVVKSGNSTSLFYDAGRLAGYVAVLPFLPFIVIGRLVKSLAGSPSTKFYYLRRTMPVFWNAVQAMSNRIASNIGLGIPQENTELAVAVRDSNGVPIRGASGEVQYEKINFDIPAEQFEQYTRLIPKLWSRNGSIDVYSLSTRAQRLADVWNNYFSELATDPTLTMDESWRSRLTAYSGKTHREMVKVMDGTPLQKALLEWYNSPGGEVVNSDNKNDPKHGELTKDASTIDRFKAYALAEARDGAQFVTLAIADAGTVSESFSNSSKTPDIGEKFNSISSGVRQARINFADGETGFAPLDAAIGAVKEVITGALEGVQMSGLLALAGNALTDIPKVWDTSTASLPSLSYTIQLRSPYGNKLSRFQSILLPLSMILAAGLPRSTGAQSYGSPFLIEIYDKGHAQSRLAMIESISVTRGVGNIGWNQDEEFLGVDVTFTATDMSSIMHMPMGTSSGPLDVVRPGGLNRAFFGDDTAYTDYISVLSSLGLADQIYRTRSLARNWRRMKLDFSSFFSVSHAASWWNGTAPGRVISALSNVRSNSN